MIQIDRFPHRKLILRLRQIVKQKFQDQGAAKSPAFDLKIRKTHRYIDILDVIDPDKSWVFHCFGETISIFRIRCGAVMFQTKQ